ncbi:RND transporter [Peptococcaceae bacterium SCADC1_2_3]|nr:RND transporter [Peptococcaceae bacterium SCADC1_2_3]KFI35967.1 RND transporter [Peptococcaceae bacterium SCADC1_2_3]
MKKRKKIYLGAGILVVLAMSIIGTVLFSDGKEVETVQVRQGSIIRAVVDNGYVQPATSYDLQATQGARVDRVLVETGQPVKQGQTLVVLENLDLAMQINEVRSQLSQAKTTADGTRAAVERAQIELKDAGERAQGENFDRAIELKDAKENFDRAQELFQAGAITRVEYDKAKQQVEICRQSLNEQNYRLENVLAQIAGLNQSLRQLTAKEQQLVVKSSVNGTVLSLPVKREQVLSPGALLASIGVPDHLEVKADILSDDLAEVKVGQKATITAPVLDQKVLKGKVKQIYPRAEEKQSALGIIQRRVPVIIALNDQANLKPGFEVKVAIETLNRQDVLILPREAICTTKDDQKEVLAVVNGRVQRRTVRTGISDHENIEITSGLTAGEMVVRDGSLDLKEKEKVKAVGT